MSRDPNDPYDHGMHEVDCPNCRGCGEIVKTVIVYNHQTKSDEFIDRAVPCDAGCQNGKVWR